MKQGRVAAPKKPAAIPPKRPKRKLPIIFVFFLLTWLWAGWYYGSVFHVGREHSFWSYDTRLMGFVLCQPYGILRYIGRAMLQLYKYPWLGGLLLASMLTAGSWLLGYVCESLKVKSIHVNPSLAQVLKTGQYFPALAYIAIVTYMGLDVFFEARTGFIFGIPFVVLVILCIWAVIIQSFKLRKRRSSVPPQDEEARVESQAGGHSGKKTLLPLLASLSTLLFLVLSFSAIVAFDQWKRPYVRVICQLLDMEYRQDWAGIQKLARANATMSNRPMACSYAISLVQTGQVAERLFDIRMDYDSLHIHGMDWNHNNASVLYVAEGNYYGGFIEPSMRACMEQMVMTGPTVRLLKLLTKCALMREEWDLADKYLAVLQRVPFEEEFLKKYSPMVRRIDLVNADKEMAMIRLTEPLHDSYESQYQQPLFMGYNLMLVEGRSKEALLNSLCVCLYTKLMPQFVERLEPLIGTTPPSIIQDGIMLAENKNPGLSQNFTGLDFRRSRMQSFFQNTQQYMKDRPGYAYELFPKYKGYYPYYYFFGNLKATKRKDNNAGTSNQGVN